MDISGEGQVSLTAIISGSYSASNTAKEARLATMLYMFRKINLKDSVLVEFGIEFVKEFWQELFNEKLLKLG